MTDSQRALNYIQGEALSSLLKHIFSHIEKTNTEDYRALAHSNSAVLNLPLVDFFLYDGAIYPDTTINGTSIRGARVTAPPLHYSLIDRFDAIQKRIRDAGHTELTNLFIHILSISAWGIVLENTLPSILISTLKKNLGDSNYHLLNQGDVELRLDRQTTEIALANLKEQHHESLENLRHTLMNQLLNAM